MSSISKTGILRVLIVCSIMLATNLPSVFAEEQPMTLQEIVNHAIKNNPAVIETEKNGRRSPVAFPQSQHSPILK